MFRNSIYKFLVVTKGVGFNQPPLQTFKFLNDIRDNHDNRDIRDSNHTSVLPFKKLIEIVV